MSSSELPEGPERTVVIAFQSIVALSAFTGLGALIGYVRRTSVIAAVPVASAGACDDDGVRLGLVLRSNGQASGPN